MNATLADPRPGFAQQRRQALLTLDKLRVARRHVYDTFSREEAPTKAAEIDALLIAGQEAVELLNDWICERPTC